MTGAAKRQVEDRRYVQLLDLPTGKLIFNCTKPLAIEGGNINNLADSNSDNGLSPRFKNAKRLCVTKPNVRRWGQKKAKALVSDEMPHGAREVKSQVLAMVQFACDMYYTLEEEKKDVVVYCKNGRSRSPNVIAAFFVLFRRYPLNMVEMWMKEAYAAQRPDTAKVSLTGFPNFERFRQVLEEIEENITTRSENALGMSPNYIILHFLPLPLPAHDNLHSRLCLLPFFNTNYPSCYK